MLPAVIEPLPQPGIEPGVSISFPHPRPCVAAQCEVPAVGHVMWLTPGWTELEIRDVCAGHLDLARRHGGCLTFPLDCLPDRNALMLRLEMEIMRRRQQAPPPMMWTFANTTAGFTQATGWIRF